MTTASDIQGRRVCLKFTHSGEAAAAVVSRGRVDGRRGERTADGLRLEGNAILAVYVHYSAYFHTGASLSVHPEIFRYSFPFGWILKLRNRVHCSPVSSVSRSFVRLRFTVVAPLIGLFPSCSVC